MAGNHLGFEILQEPFEGVEESLGEFAFVLEVELDLEWLLERLIDCFFSTLQA